MSTGIRVPDAALAASHLQATPPCRESGTAEDAASSFARLAFRDVPLGLLLAAAITSIVAGSAWTVAAGPWIWIVSLVIVGLPHGAADLPVGRFLSGRSTREWLVGSLLYVAGMACVAALFAVFPVGSIVLFSLVSIWHFGVGHRDTEPEPHASPAKEMAAAEASWPAEAAAAMARAGVVLGMPAAAWPGPTAAVADRLVSLLHAGTASSGPLFDASTVRNAGWALVATSVAAVVAEAVVRRGRGMGWLVIEISVFAALAWFADPLFSVGLYYLCWHAWRHMRSLVPACGPRSLATAMLRVHLQGLPLLLPTCAALGGLWWLLSPDHTPRDLAILSIGVYLVVTPSHDVLVRRFRDRRRRENTP